MLVCEPIEDGEVDVVGRAARVFVTDPYPEELFKLLGLDHRDGVPRVSGAGLGALVATDAFIETDLDRGHIPMDAPVVPFGGNLFRCQMRDAVHRTDRLTRGDPLSIPDIVPAAP